MAARNDAPTAAVPPAGVNHLVLNVRDIERSEDFWTRLMGFKRIGELHREGTTMRFYNGSTDNHHDLALMEVPADKAGPENVPEWSLAPLCVGINHFAIHYPDRQSWMQQLRWLQKNDVNFKIRLDHGMTHSVYVADPDGYGCEVLYELPRDIWEGDIDAALNYAEPRPTEGPEALEDNVEVPVFGED
jgi:catechol 2,3-dioxygenase